MQELLCHEFVSFYKLDKFSIDDWYFETSDSYFELEDSADEIVLLKDGGQAKFSNPKLLNCTIINHEKFITSITSPTFTHGRKRCDIIAVSSSSRYFILGELKDRVINEKKRQANEVRKGAKGQLLSSLETLVAVPEIDEFIQTGYFGLTMPPVSVFHATLRVL